MAAVGKGPHFFQKNPPAEFSGYGLGITHRCIPPYHPSSKDLAKNMVHTVKQALKFQLMLP